MNVILRHTFKQRASLYDSDQASVVQRLDSAIHRINLYPVDSSTISFPITYPVDSDLSVG